MDRDEQAAQGLKLVRRLARKYAVPSLGIHADQLEGVGVDALMETLATGANLVTVTMRRIIDYKRKEGPYTRQGNLRGSCEGKRKQLEGYRRWRDALTPEGKQEWIKKSKTRKAVIPQ